MENTVLSSPAANGNNADKVLCTALDIAEGLIKNGAAVHRAEDTIERVCRALGAIHVEAFCITSLINATIRMPNGDYASQSRRIKQSRNQFLRLDLINTISRELCAGQISLEEAQDRLLAAKKATAYPAGIEYLAAILAASSFTVFFGGNLFDALATALIAIFITFVGSFAPRVKTTFSYTLFSSLLAGLLAVFLPFAGIGAHYDKIMIGTIMLLIPGLTFGTSIRDLLCGDTISGIIQLIQSVLKAAIIAFGYIIAIYLLRTLIV